MSDLVRRDDAPAPPSPSPRLRLLLVLPPVATVMGVDVIALALGSPLPVLLEAALQDVLLKPRYESEVGGQMYDMFDIAVPDGAKQIIPLGRLGEVGIMHEKGMLGLAVPAAVKSVTERALAALILHGEAKYVGTRGTPEGFTASMACFLIRPESGRTWNLKIFNVSLGFIFP